MKHLKLMSIKIIKNSKSDTNTGYTGISKRERSGKYEVQVRFPKNNNGMKYKYQVGTFNTLEEAIKARKEFILNLF